MTLDEAREHLGLTATATVAEIRDAFRRKARAVHPDLHPDATPADHARLGRAFDHAREARDILVRYTSDRLRNEPPSPTGVPRRTNPNPQRTTQTTPPPSEAPRTSQPPNPARVTMRFDEFTAWTDSAGFGTGIRSPRYVDWTRIIVWSSLGIVVGGLVGVGIFLAVAA